MGAQAVTLRASASEGASWCHYFSIEIAPEPWLQRLRGSESDNILRPIQPTTYNLQICNHISTCCVLVAVPNPRQKKTKTMKLP